MQINWVLDYFLFKLQIFNGYYQVIFYKANFTQKKMILVDGHRLKDL